MVGPADQRTDFLERITSSGCTRELRVTDNALSGETIHFSAGTLDNDFGGTFPLAGLSLVVGSQENLADTRG